MQKRATFSVVDGGCKRELEMAASQPPVLINAQELNVKLHLTGKIGINSGGAKTDRQLVR